MRVLDFPSPLPPLNFGLAGGGSPLLLPSLELGLPDLDCSVLLVSSIGATPFLALKGWAHSHQVEVSSFHSRYLGRLCSSSMIQLCRLIHHFCQTVTTAIAALLLSPAFCHWQDQEEVKRPHHLRCCPDWVLD